MAPPSETGSLAAEMDVRDALGELAQAHAQLLATRRVTTLPWADAYRRAHPLGHPGASAPALDLRFLAAACSLGGPALLEAHRVLVTRGVPRSPPRVVDFDGGVELRVPPSVEAPADALAIALGLTVEAAKLRRALGETEPPGLALAARLLDVEASDLEAAFGDAALAEAALAALARAPASRTVHLPTADPADDPLPLEVGSGPLFVAAGATERLHDVLSPYARRLGPRLAEVVGSADAEAAYGALPVLYDEDPGCWAERLAVEGDDGIVPCPVGLLVRFGSLDASLCDPRARPLVESLARADATLLLVGRDPDRLEEGLASLPPRTRAIGLFAEGMLAPGRARFPDVVGAPGRDFVEVSNGFVEDEREHAEASLTVPSLGLAPGAAPTLPPGSAVDALLHPLLSTVVRARAHRLVERRAWLGCALLPPGDSPTASSVALTFLARLVDLSAGRPRGPRAGLPRTGLGLR